MIRTILLLLTFSLLVSSCSLSPSDESRSETPDTSDNLPDLSPNSPNVIYANNWSEVIIRANSAKTTVDIAAHFNTNRNACGKDAYGALELENWNLLAKSLNTALEDNSRVTSEYCVPIPTDTDKYMDGTVEVKQADRIRILFELKDGQICSGVSDHAVSDALLSAIHQIIQKADKEECPNGWGSA